MVLRAAMPNSATKPTIAPSVSVPPLSTTAITPPISVLGSASRISSTCLAEPNASANNRTIRSNT